MPIEFILTKQNNQTIVTPIIARMYKIGTHKRSPLLEKNSAAASRILIAIFNSSVQLHINRKNPIESITKMIATNISEVLSGCAGAPGAATGTGSEYIMKYIAATPNKPSYVTMIKLQAIQCDNLLIRYTKQRRYTTAKTMLI